MGADIHLFVEAKGGKHGHWHKLDRTVSIPDWRHTTQYHLGWGGSRNYNAFAMLANVRNGYGFAGVDTGDGFEPIDAPRGLPEDVSEEIEEESDRWGVDGHSHSYFTLRELLDLEESGYWDKTTTHRGVFLKEALEKAKAEDIVRKIEGQDVWLTRPPESYAGGISGPNIGPKDLYTIHFERTYREAAGWLTDVTIPAMTEVADSFVLNSFFTAGMEPSEEGFRPYPTVIRDKTRTMKHWVDSAELIRATFWFDN